MPSVAAVISKRPDHVISQSQLNKMRFGGLAPGKIFMSYECVHHKCKERESLFFQRELISSWIKFFTTQHYHNSEVTSFNE